MLWRKFRSWLNGDDVDPERYVVAGTTLLDEKVPGWQAAINADRLNIYSVKNCVLGQVFGDYYTGLETLGISSIEAKEYGFTTTGDRFDGLLLTMTWRVHVSRWRVSHARDVMEYKLSHIDRDRPPWATGAPFGD